MGCSQGKLKSMHSEPVLDVSPWKMLHSAPIETWVKEECLRWQVSTDRDWTAKKTRLQPWCTEGRRFEALLPAPVDQTDLDIKYRYDQVHIKHPWGISTINLSQSYKHLLPSKNRFAPFLQTAHVIGSRDKVVLVQIATNKGTCDILLIDLKTDAVIGAFREEYLDSPYLLEGFISPDYTRVLLKPNVLFTLRFRISNVTDSIRVYTKDSNAGGYILTHDLFREASLDLILTFDPRRRNTQIAIGNMTKRGQHVLCIYNIRSRKIIQKTYGPQYQRTQNLVFSPGGELLAGLIVTYVLGANMYPQRFNFLGVMIYCTARLTFLHKIQSFGIQSLVTLSPAAIFPEFSKNGNWMTLGSGNGTSVTRIDIYRMPPAVTLQGLCRAKIVSFLSPAEISRLPISRECRDYLLCLPLAD